MICTSWPPGTRSLRDEQPDVARTRDRDAHQSPPPGSMCACSVVECRRSRRRTRARRLLGRRGRSVTICALPKRVTAVSQKRPGWLSSASFLPTAFARDRPLDEPDLPGRVDPVAARLAGKQPAQHLVGGPRDGRDRRDAEALVDQRAPRVVDAGDDVLDAVGLAGDPGAQDVGVVAARHRGESPGLLDAGLRRGGHGRSRSRRPGGAGEVRPAVDGTHGRSCRRPPPSGRHCSSAPASSLPTRPQPMTTTCTWPPEVGSEEQDATAALPADRKLALRLR